MGVMQGKTRVTMTTIGLYNHSVIFTILHWRRTFVWWLIDTLHFWRYLIECASYFQKRGTLKTSIYTLWKRETLQQWSLITWHPRTVHAWENRTLPLLPQWEWYQSTYPNSLMGGSRDYCNEVMDNTKTWCEKSAKFSKLQFMSIVDRK